MLKQWLLTIATVNYNLKKLISFIVVENSQSHLLLKLTSCIAIFKYCSYWNNKIIIFDCSYVKNVHKFVQSSNLHVQYLKFQGDSKFS